MGSLLILPHPKLKGNGKLQHPIKGRTTESSDSELMKVEFILMQPAEVLAVGKENDMEWVGERSSINYSLVIYYRNEDCSLCAYFRLVTYMYIYLRNIDGG